MHGRSRIFHDLVSGSYDKRFKKPDIPHRWLCFNPKVLRSYDDDPDCGFMFTNATYRDLFTLIREWSRRRASMGSQGTCL